MNFVFITAMVESPWGGSEELWSQAASRLALAGHKTCALVPYRPRLSDKIEALRQHGVSIRTYPAPSHVEGLMRYGLDRVSLRTRRVIASLKKLSPDLVIISQGEIAGGLEWARVCGEAAIPHALVVQCNSELLWFDNDAIEKAVAAYTCARKVFCVSRGNLELLRLQVGDPLPNAEVVWNPYNVSSEAIPAWPSETDRWRVACVARLDTSAKGQDILLQVLAQREWRDRPIELNFFGAGPHELSLRRIEKLLQLKNVQFRGHVNDVRTIWEQNHLLLQPSRYEGVPMTVMEAMWCGRPAVVTDVGRTAELYVDNETGFVAPAATVSSFGQALERAWERRKEWRYMGEAARTRAEKQIPKDPVALFCDRLIASASGRCDPISPARAVTIDSETILQ